MMQEPKKPDTTIGGKMEVAKIVPFLCRFRIHAKPIIKTSPTGLVSRVCSRCGRALK